MPPDSRDDTPLSTQDFSLTGSDLAGYVRGGVDDVAALVRTTYGPRGMDKLVQLNGEKNEVVTELASSGRGVLDAIDRGDGFSHPIAAVFVDAVDTMYRDLRDGTTTSVVLTQALVTRGYELLDRGLAPSDLLVGYALAAAEVGRVYDDLSRSVSYEDTDRLAQVARTMMACRFGAAPDERYVDLVVDAVQGLAADTGGDWVDTKQVKLVSDPGATTELLQGVVVTRWPRGAEASDRSLVDFDWDPQFGDPVEDATVAVIDHEIETESSGTNFGAGSYSGIHLDSADAVRRYHAGYEERKREIAEHVAGLGVDVLVSQPRIDDDLVAHLEAVGVTVVDKVETPERDVDRLATATGATVVSRIDDLAAEHLGTAGRVFDHRATDEKWTSFVACDGPVYTLSLRAPTEHGADHLTGVVGDAVDVTATAVIDGQVLPGAGAAQMTAAAAVRDAAAGVGGREALAMAAFGAALEDGVRVLAENAGLDPIDAVASLRNARAIDGGRDAEAGDPGSADTGDGAAADGGASLDGSGDPTGDAVGLDVVTGERVNAWEVGIVDPRRVPSQALETARTTAVRLLTTDAFLYPNVALGRFTPTTEHH